MSSSAPVRWLACRQRSSRSGSGGRWWVSDAGLAKLGILDRVTALCPAASPVFLGVPTNPTEEAVTAALEMYRAHGCDGVIALGGGSPIDLAKAVALLATHPGSAGDLCRHPRRRHRDHTCGRPGDRDTPNGRHRLRGRTRRAHQR